MESIRIDIDPVEFSRRRSSVDILADAADGVRGLLAAIGRRRRPGRAQRLAAIEAAKARADREIHEIQPQLAYLDVIREVLPRDGFLCDELSQVGFASWYGFPTYLPRTFVSSGYPGTLGAGFATALGVKVIHPRREVVSICGDVGFMFGMAELASAVAHRIGTVTLVFNNGAFENVRRDQAERFGGRTIAVQLGTPDLVALGRSFGAHAVRARTPQQLRGALSKALGDDLPWLIEIPVKQGSETNPWRFIHPKPPSEDDLAAT